MNCPRCNHVIDDESAYCPWCGEAIPGAPSYDSHTFEAFISYRHLPVEQRLAKRLQRSLEGFAIPAALRSDPAKRRLGKLFRDEDELPTSFSLTDQIRAALKGSPILIVVCSPRTRESIWVQREVELFSSFHGRNNICLALCEGEPDESFPPLLLRKTVVDEDGTVREIEQEPIAADFRPEAHRHYRDEVLRVAAALVGCGYDDLHQRQRSRRQRLALSLASVVTAVSVGFGSFSLWQQKQIRENFRLAQINESELLATESTELLAQGDRYQALAIALSALPDSAESTDRPYVPAAQLALEQAMRLYPIDSTALRWAPEYSVLGLQAAGSCYGSNGVLAAFDESWSIRIFDASGCDLATIALDRTELLPDTTDDTLYVYSPYLRVIDDTVLCVQAGRMTCYDIETQEELWHFELDSLDPNTPLALDEQGKQIALATDSEDGTTWHVFLIDASSGEVAKEFSFEDSAPTSSDARSSFERSYATFSPTRDRFAMGVYGQAYVIDLKTKKVQQTRLAQNAAVEVAFVEDGLLALSQQALDTSEILVNRKMSVQRFDARLDERWSFTREESLRFGRDTSFSSSAAGLRFPIAPTDASAGTEIALLRNELFVLDDKTGEVVFDAAMDDPFVDCFYLGPYVFAVTSSGEYTSFTVDSSGGLMVRGTDNYQWNSSVSFGSAVRGRFWLYGGQLHLVLWSEKPAKGRIYTYEANGLVTHEDLRLRTYDLASDEHAATASCCFAADGVVYALDQRTLEVERATKLSDLPLLNRASPLGLYRKAGGYVYAFGPAKNADGSPATAVYVIDPQSDAEPTELLLDGIGSDTDSPAMLSEYAGENGQTWLVAHDHRHLQILSAQTGEVACSLTSPERINSCLLIGNRLVVNQGTLDTQSSAENSMIDQMIRDQAEAVPRLSASTHLKTYDATTGDEVPLPWDAFSPWNGLASCVSCSSDGERLALACADGIVRLFGTRDGTLLWESAPFESGFQSVYFDEELSNVLVQDGMGYLALLGGADGRLIITSSQATEPIKSYSAVPDSDHVVAGTYERAGLSANQGILLISLDPERFGTQSKVSQGLFCNTTADFVAISQDQAIILCYRPDLDALISVGQTMAEAHPLGNSEKQLYRLGE